MICEVASKLVARLIQTKLHSYSPSRLSVYRPVQNPVQAPRNTAALPLFHLVPAQLAGDLANQAPLPVRGVRPRPHQRSHHRRVLQAQSDDQGRAALPFLAGFGVSARIEQGLGDGTVVLVAGANGRRPMERGGPLRVPGGHVLPSSQEQRHIGRWTATGDRLVEYRPLRRGGLPGQLRRQLCNGSPPGRHLLRHSLVEQRVSTSSGSVPGRAAASFLWS